MTLEQDITTWLERQSLSLNLHDAAGRRALLFAAGLSDLQNAFDFEGATGVFCRNLTQRLWQHGILTDGRDPLIALLEAATQMVGKEGKAECAALIDRLRHTERRSIELQQNPQNAAHSNRVTLLFALIILMALAGIIAIIAHDRSRPQSEFAPVSQPIAPEKTQAAPSPTLNNMTTAVPVIQNSATTTGDKSPAIVGDNATIHY